ncbi:MAG: ABC transporter permease, partial [Pseudomonadota bacterium]|nr:ABC transporter permease [Pseudomonadota bacterium]
MARLKSGPAGENTGLLLMLAALVLAFSLASPRFLTGANLGSMGFQMPLLGLLTLAMLAPIISGGLNLAIVYTANICGLTLAWTLMQFGGAEAGIGAFLLGGALAVIVGVIAGAI